MGWNIWFELIWFDSPILCVSSVYHKRIALLKFLVSLNPNWWALSFLEKSTAEDLPFATPDPLFSPHYSSVWVILCSGRPSYRDFIYRLLCNLVPFGFDPENSTRNWSEKGKKEKLSHCGLVPAQLHLWLKDSAASGMKAMTCVRIPSFPASLEIFNVGMNCKEFPDAILAFPYIWLRPLRRVPPMTQFRPSFLPGPWLTSPCFSSRTTKSLDLGVDLKWLMHHGWHYMFVLTMKRICLLFVGLFLELFLKDSNSKPLPDEWHHAPWRAEPGTIGPCLTPLPSPGTSQLCSLPTCEAVCESYLCIFFFFFLNLHQKICLARGVEERDVVWLSFAWAPIKDPNLQPQDVPWPGMNPKPFGI